jgi:hypothetical protein
MRVLIACPRKTGNAQLRCLVATAYGLELIGSRDAPDGSDITAIGPWFESFPDRWVAHTSFQHSPELLALLVDHGVSVIAVLRHPFDLLVSIHEIAQRRTSKKGRRLRESDPWEFLAGRDLGDPVVMEYAIDGFADEIEWLKGWHDSGVPLVRFELLEAAPSEALADLARALGHLDENQIARAVETCPAENLIWSSPVLGRRMPPVPAGAWRERLADGQLSILRQRYGDDVRRLGYEPV